MRHNNSGTEQNQERIQNDKLIKCTKEGEENAICFPSTSHIIRHLFPRVTHTCDIPRSRRVLLLLTPLPDGPLDGLNLSLLAFFYPIFFADQPFFMSTVVYGTCIYRVSY